MNNSRDFLAFVVLSNYFHRAFNETGAEIRCLPRGMSDCRHAALERQPDIMQLLHCNHHYHCCCHQKAWGALLVNLIQIILKWAIWQADPPKKYYFQQMGELFIPLNKKIYTPAIMDVEGIQNKHVENNNWRLNGIHDNYDSSYDDWLSRRVSRSLLPKLIRRGIFAFLDNYGAFCFCLGGKTPCYCLKFLILSSSSHIVDQPRLETQQTKHTNIMLPPINPSLP